MQQENGISEADLAKHRVGASLFITSPGSILQPIRRSSTGSAVSQQAFPTHFSCGHIIGFADCTSSSRGVWDMHQHVTRFVTLASLLLFNLGRRRDTITFGYSRTCLGTHSPSHSHRPGMKSSLDLGRDRLLQLFQPG